MLELIKSSNLEDVILGIRMIYRTGGKKFLKVIFSGFKHNLSRKDTDEFDYIKFPGCIIFFDHDTIDYFHKSDSKYRELTNIFIEFKKF